MHGATCRGSQRVPRSAIWEKYWGIIIPGWLSGDARISSYSAFPWWCSYFGLSYWAWSTQCHAFIPPLMNLWIERELKKSIAPPQRWRWTLSSSEKLWLDRYNTIGGSNCYQSHNVQHQLIMVQFQLMSWYTRVARSNVARSNVKAECRLRLADMCPLAPRSLRYITLKPPCQKLTSVLSNQSDQHCVNSIYGNWQVYKPPSFHTMLLPNTLPPPISPPWSSLSLLPLPSWLPPCLPFLLLPMRPPTSATRLAEPWSRTPESAPRVIPGTRTACASLEPPSLMLWTLVSSAELLCGPTMASTSSLLLVSVVFPPSPTKGSARSKNCKVL